MSDIETPVVEARASVRYLHVSPTKVRPVLDLVRGLPAEDAERMLQLTPRDSADHILKVLESAMANAEHNFQLPPDELFITRCWCDEGPTRGAGRARARGRYFRIRKRTSHITIVLGRLSEADLETRRTKAEATGTGRAGSARRRAERVRASRRAARGEAEHDHDHDHAGDEANADLTELETVEAVEQDDLTWDTDATQIEVGDETTAAEASSGSSTTSDDATDATEDEEEGE
jgi:large subunit ribosomal protein L22